MSESSPKYLIRDSQGNVYGPADDAMLRDWVQQGRIVAGMHIAPRETREWIEASQHPLIADLFPANSPSLGTSPQPTTPADPAPTPTSFPQEPAPVTRRIPDTPPSPSTYPAATTVPYLGSPIDPSLERPRINTLALVGFIASLAGLVLAICPCAQPCSQPIGSMFFGLIAIVLGGIGLYQIKLNPPRFTGPGLSIAAIVMGALSLLVAVGWLMLFFLKFKTP